MKKKVTKRQLDILKFVILNSRDCGDETKKACLALIDASEKLTKSVFCTGYSEDITFGLHNMLSLNGKTHLDSKLSQLDTKLKFSHFGGYFHNGKLINYCREGKKYTHTIILSPYYYGSERMIEVTAEQVEAIDLKAAL